MYVTLLYPPATKLMLPIFVKRRHIRKVVLYILLEEWRAVLGNIAEDSRIISRHRSARIKPPTLRLTGSPYQVPHLRRKEHLLWRL